VAQVLLKNIVYEESSAKRQLVFGAAAQRRLSQSPNAAAVRKASMHPLEKTTPAPYLRLHSQPTRKLKVRKGPMGGTTPSPSASPVVLGKKKAPALSDEDRRRVVVTHQAQRNDVQCLEGYARQAHQRAYWSWALATTQGMAGITSAEAKQRARAEACATALFLGERAEEKVRTALEDQHATEWACLAKIQIITVCSDFLRQESDARRALLAEERAALGSLQVAECMESCDGTTNGESFVDAMFEYF
jgi:hypothetical protein